MKREIVLLIGTLFFLFVGCAPTPTPTPALTTPLPTATRVPTLTWIATVTSSPSPTARPTATPTAAPTATPRPSGKTPVEAILIGKSEDLLAPQSALWFRFEYGGDRTTMTVALDADGATGISMQIFTAEQMDTWARGESVSPLGRGGYAAPIGHDLAWTGNTPRAGMYYALVTNHSDKYVVARVFAAGPAVLSSLKREPTPTPVPNPFATVIPFNLEERATALPIFFPADFGKPPLLVAVPSRPSECTSPEQMPEIITQSVLLCEKEVYRNLRIRGSHIGLFGDRQRSAQVVGDGRNFALTIEGSHIFVHAINFQTSTHPDDRKRWLCIVEACTYTVKDRTWTVAGGTSYGGGILLKASDSVISSVDVRGSGTIGIALVRAHNNILVNNHFDRVTGWGVYGFLSDHNYYLGNSLSQIDRDCFAPEGVYYSFGCETAGWLCMGCQGNIIAHNQCALSGNCYYAQGDGGVASNNNRFYGNYCFGARNNCFEATFSKGNDFEKNVTTRDPVTREECHFPFWIGGSIVRFGRGNEWACTVSAERAIELSAASTSAPTQVLR